MVHLYRVIVIVIVGIVWKGEVVDLYEDPGMPDYIYRQPEHVFVVVYDEEMRIELDWIWLLM